MPHHRTASQSPSESIPPLGATPPDSLSVSVRVHPTWGVDPSQDHRRWRNRAFARGTPAGCDARNSPPTTTPPSLSLLQCHTPLAPLAHHPAATPAALALCAASRRRCGTERDLTRPLRGRAGEREGRRGPRAAPSRPFYALHHDFDLWVKLKAVERGARKGRTGREERAASALHPRPLRAPSP